MAFWNYYRVTFTGLSGYGGIAAQANGTHVMTQRDTTEWTSDLEEDDYPLFQLNRAGGLWYLEIELTAGDPTRYELAYVAGSEDLASLELTKVLDGPGDGWPNTVVVYGYNFQSGGGGGGGAICEGYLDSNRFRSGSGAIKDYVLQITIGAGGTGGSVGTDGQNTTVIDEQTSPVIALSAAGGKGGASASYGLGGDASDCIGDTDVQATSGGDGGIDNVFFAGGGGGGGAGGEDANAQLGGLNGIPQLAGSLVANGAIYDPENANIPADEGVFPGGGGGGGAFGAPVQNGEDGAKGFVRLRIFYDATLGGNAFTTTPWNRPFGSLRRRL